MGRTIGYAREPNGAVQEKRLRSAGATRVFVDDAEAGRAPSTAQLEACLQGLRRGDVLLVDRLSRLGRSERVIIEVLLDLGHRGVDVKSLTEKAIDTTAGAGGDLLDIVESLARARADARREDTVRGLLNARAEGRVGGRPTVMRPELLAEARRMRAAGRSLADIARVLGVGASSVSRALAKPGHDVATAEPNERRVFFRDTKPYEAPVSLAELCGPPGGTLELPHPVYWGPQRLVDLDTPSGVRKAYQAVLREGSADDQARILNRDVLLREWAGLALPDRVRVLWERRFPELRVGVTS